MLLIKIVYGWYPREDSKFHGYVAYLAEGYVRFARMVATALYKERIEKGTLLSLEELLNKNEITTFLEQHGFSCACLA